MPVGLFHSIKCFGAEIEKYFSWNRSDVLFTKIVSILPDNRSSWNGRLIRNHADILMLRVFEVVYIDIY